MEDKWESLSPTSVSVKKKKKYHEDVLLFLSICFMFSCHFLKSGVWWNNLICYFWLNVEISSHVITCTVWLTRKAAGEHKRQTTDHCVRFCSKFLHVKMHFFFSCNCCQTLAHGGNVGVWSGPAQFGKCNEITFVVKLALYKKDWLTDWLIDWKHTKQVLCRTNDTTRYRYTDKKYFSTVQYNKHCVVFTGLEEDWNMYYAYTYQISAWV